MHLSAKSEQMRINNTSTKSDILHDVVLRAAGECWLPCHLTTTLHLHPVALFPSVIAHIEEH